MSTPAFISRVRYAVDTPLLRWLMLPAICAAYIQGGLVKALDFNGAMAEMTHFGLQPAALFAGLVVLLELGASALILTGFYRWLGALALAGFTLAATLMANRFWEMSPPERFIGMNGFFEHIGLAGALLLVALYDLKEHKNG
ncbi:Inner membrane protein yphA [Serratia quinivorans]|uniref:DoxX family protein n=1 Tax=Serratia quinivorans TaxID=137545 RepID=UPI00217A51E7|nr:DoxX family protein [Serratia quinivorans]CAI0721991.1 Inner membrane protein yphA [Serratia quinivorans]CAI0745440.1 Inner membrane protein yphA [Serratia quinivorans]CAI1507807.1 Inner membrane protein yphA [Serratia quinivorans]CAI1536706.1 Inner membrane protein yphA [Serratia quinivorans]CAI1594200.1 Inner membrane protein yphA [Serratia quinivorans]